MADKEEAKKVSEEPMKAKVAYDLYESMGIDRSIAKVAEAMGKTAGYKRHLEDWSSRYKWVERARKWDEEQLEKKRKRRERELDELYDDLAQICKDQRSKTLKDIEKLRKSDKLGAIATVNLLKLLIDTHVQVLGGNEKQKIELTGKDSGPMDIEVTTFWGRGTDPRKRTEPVEEPAKEGDDLAESDDEDPEVSVEFGVDIPEDEED